MSRLFRQSGETENLAAIARAGSPRRKQANPQTDRRRIPGRSNRDIAALNFLVREHGVPERLTIEKSLRTLFLHRAIAAPHLKRLTDLCLGAKMPGGWMDTIPWARYPPQGLSWVG